MTKSDLIDALLARAPADMKLSRARAEQVVAAIFEAMTDALSSGEGIEIRGFGTFTVRDYKGYRGRNPKTGVRVEVAPKRLPFFRAGKDLRETVDAGRGFPIAEDREGDPRE